MIRKTKLWSWNGPKDGFVYESPLQREIVVTTYRTGGIVHWPMQGKGRSSAEIEARRGSIHDMSARSRIRAAFAFCNAPLDWFAMATLTFAVQPKFPKDAFKRLVRRFNIEIEAGKYQWGWVMEFQLRGVIHFHLFFERRFLDCFEWHVEPLVRQWQRVDVVRGRFDEWLREKWHDAVYGREITPSRIREGVDLRSSASLMSKTAQEAACSISEIGRFNRFHAGGIVELLRSPEGAGRYIAKEAGKRAQKRLPPDVEGAGRWWWLNPRFKPRPTGTMIVETWPWEFAYKHVFDLRDLNRPRKIPERGVTVSRGELARTSR